MRSSNFVLFKTSSMSSSIRTSTIVIASAGAIVTGLLGKPWHIVIDMCCAAAYRSCVMPLVSSVLANSFACTAYAVYFDHKRRSDPDFRKALKRESRREARAAKEEAEAQGMQQKQAIEDAVNVAREEGFPADVEDKEAYFMNEVGQGEVLCQDGTFGISHG